MDAQTFSRLFAEGCNEVERYNDVDDRREAATVFLQDHPVCLSNMAFVGAMYTFACRTAVSNIDIMHALTNNLENDENASIYFSALHELLQSTLYDGGVFSGWDVNAAQHLIEDARDDAIDPVSVSNILVAWRLFPLCSLIIAASGSAADRFVQDGRDEFATVLEQTMSYIVPALLQFGHGRADRYEVDAQMRAAGPPHVLVQQIIEAVLFPWAPVICEDLAVGPTEISFCAHAVASAVAEGLDFESAVVACGISMAEFAEMAHFDYFTKVARTDPDVADAVPEPPALKVFGEYVSALQVIRVVIESTEAWIYWMRSYVDEHLTVLTAPLVFLIDALGKAGTSIHGVVSQIIGIVLDLAETHHWMDAEARATVGAIMVTVADLIDIKHRKNPKSVWALLSSRKGARLSKAEIFMTQLATFHHEPSPTYEAWAEDMIRRLGKGPVDASILNISPPDRAVYYPAHTFGPADNNDLETAVKVNFHETAQVTRRVQQALAKGAPRGIDSAWLATATNIQRSIDRYVVPRPTLPLDAKVLLEQAADAWFDHSPERYDKPVPMSVAAAMLAVEWKYSAGCPWIPVIRTRQQLKQWPWYQSIAKAAESLLEDGIVRDVVFHAFPKADVVPRDKVIADRSAIRTVTAGDRITAIVANTLLGEVNKRVAPLESWVANQLPRREGGMQELYEALHQRPVIVSTDGWRFDSQVPAEVMSIGSTRLYHRGIQGYWGAKAATSFVEAYYQSVAHGLVVNLADGRVTRKTGGGGTGSAFTSSDNSSWARILMAASWARAFDRPVKEFFNHVTFANASDDIIFSADGWMRGRLQEWQDEMLVTFGLRFDFEEQADHDGFLHLRVVPEAMLDRGMYEKLGIPVPKYPVMHDPARTATKRSDFRSDRMRHNYMMAADHIATQDFGHMLLVAHDRQTYHDIATEAMEATSEFLSFFFDEVTFKVDYAQDDLITSFTYTHSDRPSNKLRRVVEQRKGPMHTPEAQEYVRRQHKIARDWVRCHRYPSYFEVFKAWVMPEDWSRLRPAQKKWQKIVAHATLDIPLIDNAQAAMLYIADVTAKIPTALTRWGGKDIVPISRPLVTSAFSVEAFIYAKFLENNNGVAPSFGEFTAKCRESPWAGLTAPNEYTNFRASPYFDSDFRNVRDMVVLQGRMWMLTLTYALIDVLNTKLRMNRLFGFVLGLFFLLVRDLDKWYSILHMAYWLDKGEASVMISNMSPRDPFIAQKVMALLISAWVPHALYRPMGWLAVWSTWCRRAAEAAYYYNRFTVGAAMRAHVGLAERGDRWAELRVQLLVGIVPEERIDKIDAGMGSGKSTSAPVEILSDRGFMRVYIMVPTRALVVNYVNPFIDPSEVLRADHDTWQAELSGKRIIVITAVRLATVSLPSDHQAESLMLVDEAHMSTTAQIVAYYRHRNMRRILMSGTVEGWLFEHAPGRTYHLPAPEAPVRTVHEIAGSVNVTPQTPSLVVDWVREVLQHAVGTFGVDPDMSPRFAVYHPARSVVSDIQILLQRSGYLASVTTADNPGISDRGVVVGTWAIVTGVNFKPPIAAMIDTGMETVVEPTWTDIDAHRGGLADGFRNRATSNRLRWSSPSTRGQVAARTGRTQNGIVYVHPKAGTSPLAPVYHDVLMLLEYGHILTAGPGSPTILEALGVTVEVSENPHSPFVHHVLRYVHIGPACTTRGRVYAPQCAYILLLATALASLERAILAVRDPLSQDVEVQRQMVRLGLMFPDDLRLFGPGDFPTDIEALCGGYGFKVGQGLLGVIYARRPLVFYPDRISVSGLYPRSKFYAD